MKISLNLLVRIIGMIALAYTGYSVGRGISNPVPTETELAATMWLTLAGAGLGLLTTHRWTIEPIQEVLRYIKSVAISELIAIVFGALLGLVFAVLFSVPLARLPGIFGQVLPLATAVGLSYLGGLILSQRKRDLAEFLRAPRRSSMILSPPFMEGGPLQRRYLVDTSAIIDGRIASVSQTGFIEGTLLVPHFVLNELQMLADSSDELRRSKGRRGLEILNTMQKEAFTPVEVINAEVNGLHQVDDKLVLLARQYHCPIITNDHNLGRVAELQGVKILSLNQLADAVRPPVEPGQDITVTIRDVGREREQGISFLTDGTMIVVEDARRLIGQTIVANVTRVYQTQTGRIVFAQLKTL